MGKSTVPTPTTEGSPEFGLVVAITVTLTPKQLTLAQHGNTVSTAFP